MNAKRQKVNYMTTVHLKERMESIILRHNKDMHKIELKMELVELAKEWMSKSEVVGIDEKFNTWNSELAHLVQKHNLKGAKH
jgi:hypothetical protein